VYAVSLYPERTRRVKGRTVDAERLRAFIADNLDLLRDPRNSVGLWYSEEEAQTYVDVSATLPDKATAVTMGQAYNQIAIFDLKRMELIDVGGDGSPLADLPLATQRLPPRRESGQRG
jgi:hypothetical protein